MLWPLSLRLCVGSFGILDGTVEHAGTAEHAGKAVHVARDLVRCTKCMMASI